MFAAFTLGVAAVMFAPGKRLNLAALLYQLCLYPLFDLTGLFSGDWY